VTQQKILKLYFFFVIALTKVRTVNFESLVKAFYTEAEFSSNLRRIQRFISGYSLLIINCTLYFSHLTIEP